MVIGIIIIFSLIGCQAQIDPREKRPGGSGPDPDSPLIGTSWFWDGGWGAVTLYFESAETVLFNEEARHAYSYDKSTRIGQADSLGRFTVTNNYERMVFSPTWRNYPHGADFTRMRSEE
ncbi:MAG: hypothetical protein FWD36_07935 [Treponema sp.]|nr:hypothetical protein [Treponema sp.]